MIPEDLQTDFQNQSHSILTKKIENYETLRKHCTIPVVVHGRVFQYWCIFAMIPSVHCQSTFLFDRLHEVFLAKKINHVLSRPLISDHYFLRLKNAMVSLHFIHHLMNFVVGVGRGCYHLSDFIFSLPTITRSKSSVSDLLKDGNIFKLFFC